MAEHVPTTSSRDAEAAGAPDSSPAVVAALALSAALDRLIAAERDLEGYSGADPAVDPWLREAETALGDVLHECSRLQKAPGRNPGDGRLRLVGGVISGVMRCTDAGELAQRMVLVEERRALLHMDAGTAAGAAVNRLIDGLLDRLEASVALAEGPDWQDGVTDADTQRGDAPDMDPDDDGMGDMGPTALL